MGNRQMMPTLSHLCKVVCPTSGTSVSDRELLERFLTRRDETAFELLVWRHGPMVLGICSRLLQRPADVEDAFQATFLMLLRKAQQIQDGGSFGAWLYKVAYRIALRVRSQSDSRAVRERALATLPHELASTAKDSALWQDLQPILDAEVSRLPAKYRAAFVLCCLEGKTNTEAAVELGCARGTVDSRLARARERLKTRLARRGIVVGSLAFAALLSEQTARLAEAAPVLVNGTVQAAVLWSARGLMGVASVSRGAAELLQAEVQAFWRRWYLLAGLFAILGVTATSWSVYAHGVPRLAGVSQTGCGMATNAPAAVQVE